jgi:hypothetical protein
MRRRISAIGDHARPRAKGQYLGRVEAPDADAAIKLAIKEYGITDPHRQRRLVA